VEYVHSTARLSFRALNCAIWLGNHSKLSQRPRELLRKQSPASRLRPFQYFGEQCWSDGSKDYFPDLKFRNLQIKELDWKKHTLFGVNGFCLQHKVLKVFSYISLTVLGEHIAQDFLDTGLDVLFRESISPIRSAEDPPD